MRLYLLQNTFWSTSGVQVKHDRSMSGVRTPGVSPFPLGTKSLVFSLAFLVLKLFIKFMIILLSDNVLYETVNVASRFHGVKSSRIQNAMVPVPTAAVPKIGLYFYWTLS